MVAQPVRPFLVTLTAVLVGAGLSGCVDPAPVGSLGLIGWRDPQGMIGLETGDEVTLWVGENPVDPAGAADLPVRWSFGDGATGTGNPVTHRYVVEGRYFVTAEHDGLEADQSLAVDMLQEFLAPVPNFSPVGNEKPQPAVRFFETREEARHVVLRAEFDGEVDAVLHARVVDRDGATFIEASAPDVLEERFDAPSPRELTLELWTEGWVGPHEVHVHLAVIY